MKYSIKYHIAAVLVLSYLFGCNQMEEIEEQYIEQAKTYRTFTAVVKDSSLTKTFLDGKLGDELRQILWLPSDEICVYEQSSYSYSTFRNTCEDTTAIAVFVGDAVNAPVYYAVYPRKIFEGFSDERQVIIKLHETQNYKSGTFHSDTFPMLAKSSREDETLQFQNICGILAVNITGEGSVTSIRFISKDNPVSGRFTIDHNSEYPSIVGYGEDANETLILDCGTGVQLNSDTPATFYMVLPAGTYRNFSIAITTTDGRTMYKHGNNPLTIKRSNLTSAGTFSYIDNMFIDLSEKGNSNCYIVPMPGAYSFDATTIGNGEFGIIPNAGFHTDEPHISPTSAELLWEDKDGMITGVSYADSRISFMSTGLEGNALIAAKDADGNILWSWHIWVTDQPKEQHYINTAGEFYVHDRNLGATRSDRGEGDEWHESCGIEYQWGRKDPFVGNIYTESSYKYTINDAISNPTQKDRDWGWSPSENLWSPTSKTIYDPCPLGYRVANDEIWKDFSINNTSGKFDNGYYFLYDGNKTAWYPNKANQTPSGIEYWGDCYMTSSTYQSGLYFSNGSTRYQSIEYGPLRCMKDTETSTYAITYKGASAITSTSASVAGNISISGSPEVTRRGFVYGKTTDISLDNGTAVDAGSGEGELSAELSGLTPGTKYYVRIFAVTDDETLYSSVYSFRTQNSEGVIDLSVDGTANCYIISQSGTYSFNGTVKGNSTESVGNPDSAVIVWETLNTTNAVTQGSVISEISFTDGKVTFKTPEIMTPGNALIAVKDITGTIIWSWHIWAVEFDPEGSAQLYPSGALLMDRNLGALCTTHGDVRSYGLFYQWGRKDPFVGSGNLEGNSFASTYPADVKKYINSEARTNNLEYATMNPMAVISGSTWNQANFNNLWWHDVKTKYDPCPTNWRVAENDSWKELEFDKYDGFGEYYTLTYPTAYYPWSGYTGGNNTLKDVNSYGNYIWSSTTTPGSFEWANYTLYYFSSNGIRTSNQYNEMAVRCMRDAAFEVTTSEASTIADTYAIISGELVISDNTVMESKGFIYSSITDTPKLGTEGCLTKEMGTEAGIFSSSISGLKPSTTYYIRAYAKGGHNTRYGEIISFKTKAAADNEGYGVEDFEW